MTEPISPENATRSVESAPSDQPLRTFKLELSYDGTHYHGWQRQSNGITVQETIETRLEQLFGGIPIRIQGSSRTDAGVHALAAVASFRAPESPYIPDWKVQKALNRLLPSDIRIRSAEVVADSFNARFSALGKSYVYCVNTGELNPFANRYCWHREDMNRIEELRQAIKYIEGRHDFSTFTVERSRIDDPVRTIFHTDVLVFGPVVCFHFVGEGFLYKMVRSLTGALLFVGRGLMPPEWMGDILDRRDRRFCKDTAPAKGLFLKKVFYEAPVHDTVTEIPFHWI